MFFYAISWLLALYKLLKVYNKKNKTKKIRVWNDEKIKEKETKMMDDKML